MTEEQIEEVTKTDENGCFLNLNKPDNEPFESENMHGCPDSQEQWRRERQAEEGRSCQDNRPAADRPDTGSGMTYHPGNQE